MRHLRSCYLFRGCPQRFLDTLLASARVEVFMPGEAFLDCCCCCCFINQHGHWQRWSAANIG